MNRRVDEYAARMREPGDDGRPRDPYACAVGSIRGLTYKHLTGTEAFRDEVIAVLDAFERVRDEQMGATSA